MEKKASVDIILPNFNSSEFLEDTIQSIINQEYLNWKLIIIDDCSNEPTKQILRKYSNHNKIKIILLKKNMGAGFCRNLGLRLSNSDFIAFIDSDDQWMPNKITEQVGFMEKNKLDFTYTNYSTFKNKNILNKIAPPTVFDFKSFIKNTSICTSSMMITSNYAKKYKFTKTKICEDYFYKCCLLKKLKNAHCLNLFLTKYRIRKKSLQSNNLRNFYWIWKINKNYNQLSLLENFISLISITFNSIKKYGFK